MPRPYEYRFFTAEATPCVALFDRPKAAGHAGGFHDCLRLWLLMSAVCRRFAASQSCLRSSEHLECGGNCRGSDAALHVSGRCVCGVRTGQCNRLVPAWQVAEQSGLSLASNVPRTESWAESAIKNSSGLLRGASGRLYTYRFRIGSRGLLCIAIAIQQLCTLHTKTQPVKVCNPHNSAETKQFR